MAKKKQHGGKREGAGRKPANQEGRGETLGGTVPGRHVAKRMADAGGTGWNKSKAVTEAIRSFLAAKKRRA